MLIREGGLLLERVGAFEKLFQGGGAQTLMIKEKMKLGSWGGAAGLCQGTNIALLPTWLRPTAFQFANAGLLDIVGRPFVGR